MAQKLSLSQVPPVTAITVVILAHAPRMPGKQMTGLVDQTLASLARQREHRLLSDVSTVVMRDAQWADCLRALKTPWVVFVDAGDELANHFFQDVSKLIADDPHLRFISFDEVILSEQPMLIRKPILSPDLEAQIGYLSTGFVIHRQLLRSCLPKEIGKPVNLPGLVCLNLMSQLTFTASCSARPRATPSVTHVRARTSPGFFARHLRAVLLHRHPANPVRHRRERSRRANLEREQCIKSLGFWPMETETSHPSKETGSATLWTDASAHEALIIVPTRDLVDSLRDCIDSIWDQTQGVRYQICVIDNGSEKSKSLRYLEGLPALAASKNKSLTVVRDGRPFDFAALNNAVALGELSKQVGVLVFLNNDIQIRSPFWLSDMVFHARRAGVGCVGVQLQYPDGNCQHSGVNFEGPHLANNHDPPMHPLTRGVISNPLAVTGAAMAIRADLFKRLGGFDPQFAVSYNDVDLCLRAEAHGLRTVCLGHVVLLHHESRTRRELAPTPARRRQERIERQVFTQRWQSLLNTIKQPPIRP